MTKHLYPQNWFTWKNWRRSGRLFSRLVIWVSLMGPAIASAVPDQVSTCVACHGEKGVSANPLWPNLAGQKVDYIIKQITDFREGRRSDPLMSPIAKALNETDIKALADFFSSLRDQSP